MNYIRESTVAISNMTRWKLTRIVAASDPHALDSKLTVDSLAERILDGWITLNHSALHALWAEREAINDRAHKAVNEKATF